MSSEVLESSLFLKPWRLYSTYDAYQIFQNTVTYLTFTQLHKLLELKANPKLNIFNLLIITGLKNPSVKKQTNICAHTILPLPLQNTAGMMLNQLQLCPVFEFPPSVTIGILR